MQHFILEVDTPYSITSLLVDTSKSKQDEVLISMRGVRGTPSKAFNLTTEKGFVSSLAY